MDGVNPFSSRLQWPRFPRLDTWPHTVSCPLRWKSPPQMTWASAGAAPGYTGWVPWHSLWWSLAQLGHGRDQRLLPSDSSETSFLRGNLDPSSWIFREIIYNTNNIIYRYSMSDGDVLTFCRQRIDASHSGYPSSPLRTTINPTRANSDGFTQLFTCFKTITSGYVGGWCAVKALAWWRTYRSVAQTAMLFSSPPFPGMKRRHTHTHTRTHTALILIKIYKRTYISILTHQPLCTNNQPPIWRGFMSRTAAAAARCPAQLREHHCVLASGWRYSVIQPALERGWGYVIQYWQANWA